ILGSSVYNPREGTFAFKPGPIFTNVVLAAELNRASPRTQSSLLEDMSERQASLEVTTHVLPSPFLVIATQNPIEFHGPCPTSLPVPTPSSSLLGPTSSTPRRTTLSSYSSPKPSAIPWTTSRPCTRVPRPSRSKQRFAPSAWTAGSASTSWTWPTPPGANRRS